MAKKSFTPPKNSKKTTIDIQSLEAEKNRLYISGDNDKRLKEVIDKINWFYYGIIITKN